MVKIKVLAWSGEGPLWVADFWLCSYSVEGTRGLSGPSTTRQLFLHDFSASQSPHLL